MKRILILTFVLGSLLLAACNSPAISATGEGQPGEKVSVDGGEYTNITVAEIQGMLDDKDFTFINVHIPYAGDIPQTDLSIPYDEIAGNLDQLPADKNAKIVLYCRSGSMSSMAAEDLVQLGYTNVWNLSGGMVAWQNAGLPLENQP